MYSNVQCIWTIIFVLSRQLYKYDKNRLYHSVQLKMMSLLSSVLHEYMYIVKHHNFDEP